MPPKVTLIIPTYNRAHLLPRALNSALQQDYPALDIIVVDDGSTDHTLQVLEPYLRNPRIRLIRHDHNRGVTAAKNTGLDHLPADTVYFGILDSDDRLYPYAVSRLVAAFERHPNDYSQVFGWCQDPDSGAHTGISPVREGIIRYEDVLCGRFRGEFWQLTRKELLGTLRFDERAGGGEGSVWWPLLKLAPAQLIATVVRDYDRSGPDRVSLPKLTPAAALKKMWVFRSELNAVGEDMRRLCPSQYAAHRLEEAKWACLAGRKTDGWQAWRQAIRTHRSWRALYMSALLLVPPRLLRFLFTFRYA